MRLTQVLAVRVCERMKRDGFDNCRVAHVWDAYRIGDLPGDESLCSRILQEFEELGIEVPA